MRREKTRFVNKCYTITSLNNGKLLKTVSE